MNRFILKEKLSHNLASAKACVKNHPKTTLATALLSVGAAVLTVAVKHHLRHKQAKKQYGTTSHA